MDHLGRLIADTVCFGFATIVVVVFYNFGLDKGLLDLAYIGPMTVFVAGAGLVQIRRRIWD